MHITAGGGLTRLLVVVLVAVMSRWVDLRTGWPDFVTLPAVALAGLVLVEGLVVAPDQRLGWRHWVANLAVLAALAAFMALSGG